ncbi:MAG TPA: cytochrome c, partial [Deinococcales bacterium]|nr:cytochrome c [Deinococcales bacterium]
ITLLAVGACLALGACKTQVSGNLNGVSTGHTDALTVQGSKLPTSASTYNWNYPQYPTNYRIDPLSRDFASGREIGENGSLAGPWLQGEAAKLLPVGQPNVIVGQQLLEQLQRGGAIPAAALPKLSDSPYQAFLKLRDAIGTRQVNGVPITRDQLWDVTFWLYTKNEPDFGIAIPVQMDPASKTDPSKRKNGSQLFGSNCAMCHGSDGWGRGSSGKALQPPPANFHDPRRLYNRSEDRLYTVLRNGIFGTAMPPWRDKLSDAEIRSIVAYVRSFSYSVENLAPAGAPPATGAGSPGSPVPQTAAPSSAGGTTSPGSPANSTPTAPAGGQK